jgi:predicted phage terminase large subunit-like protein
MALKIPEGKTVIRPQDGMQMKLATCRADIAICGGSAYSGKTFGLLYEPLRAVAHPKFNGVFFRREMPQITAGGGPWDTAVEIYGKAGSIPIESKHIWRWPHGAKMKLTHMQRVGDRMAHHSAAYVYIAFDELQTFEELQFWYLFTRLRPPPGYRGRCWMRAGCNPDADGWLRELIDWWIGPDGFAIPERSGVIRHFTRKDDKIIWVSAEWRDPQGNPPKTFTFIQGSIEENKIGNEIDPTYRVNLYSQDMVTRERLLYGNWNISYKGGMFSPDWFKIIELSEVPHGLKIVRYWDMAATPEDEEESNDPDWTVGACVGTLRGDIYILDVERLRDTPAAVESKIKRTAELDGKNVIIGLEEEKGSSGKYVGDHYKRNVLPEYDVRPDPVSGSKIERAKPVAAAAEFGHVYVVRGEWNRAFLAEFGTFPLHKKDQVDAVSGAVKILKMQNRVWPRFNRTDKECCRPFDIQWNNVAHYGALCMSKDMNIHLLTAVWYKDARRLYVYGELIGPEMSATKIAAAIVSGMQYKKYQVNGLYGNDEMFGTGRGTADVINDEISAVCRANSIPCRAVIQKPLMYDIMGSVGRASLMFHDREIIVHEQVEEGAKQFSGWYIEDGKPAKGFEMCKCLCIIVGEVTRTYRIPKEKPPIDGYRKRVVKDKKPRMNSFQMS